MQVVSWNIQQGGGRRIAGIAETLIERAPDVIVLGEYMPDRSDDLVGRLLSAGWPHLIASQPPERFGGLAVLSRHSIEARPLPLALSAFAYRCQSVSIPALDLILVAVYGPLDDSHHAFWEAMLSVLRSTTDAPVLLVGDLNTGAGRTDSTARTVFAQRYFEQIERTGYVDLWRQANGDAREYTWRCVNRGQVSEFRLDHAFGTPSVAARLVGCRYDHSVVPRLSDHSLMTVELD